MKKLIAVLAVSVVSLVGVEARAANALASASATVITPIDIVKTTNLRFGTFAAGGGYVAIAADGTRSGDAPLLSADAGGAASFSISGEPNASFAVSFPDGNTVTMLHTNGVDSLTAVSFVTSSSRTLDGSGSRALTMGASLNVGGNQLTGNYSGDFHVAVQYN